MSKRTSRAALAALALTLAVPSTAAAQAPADARAELDAHRLVLRGKATAATGLTLLAAGGFLLVGGMASSGTTYDDGGEPGKRLAAGGFAVLMAGSLVALGGLVAALAGHRRLDRLRRARLTLAPARHGALLGLRASF